jgi:hypothetical protein
MKLKKDRVCRKCYIFLFETIKSVSINCLSGTAKYGHTCDTQNFRHSMNHLVVFTLKTWEQILDAFYISATHVSTPKRCLNLYWQKFCIYFNCQPSWSWDMHCWDAASITNLTFSIEICWANNNRWIFKLPYFIYWV